MATDAPPVDTGIAAADISPDPVPGAEASPLVLLEMIHRLKVRDVMCTDIFTLDRQAP